MLHNPADCKFSIQVLVDIRLRPQGGKFPFQAIRLSKQIHVPAFLKLKNLPAVLNEFQVIGCYIVRI